MKELEVICFGEILWDELKSGRRLGGAPLNVCYHLSKLGISTSIITQVGNDADGKAILVHLDRLGINTASCMITGSKPTSTVEVHLAENNEVTYKITEDVAWDDIAYSPGLGDLVKGSKILVFGSLAARGAVSRDTLFELIGMNSFRVFDVNLRYPFYSKELILSLLMQTHLLKLNQEELHQISAWLGGTAGSEQDAIRVIRETCPNIEEILLTCGHRGAVYIRGEEWERVPAYNVGVKDTVGSGDSFLAAFIAARLKGVSIDEALDHASLLSGYIATRNGACPDYDIEDLRDFKESFRFPDEKKNNTTNN